MDRTKLKNIELELKSYLFAFQIFVFLQAAKIVQVNTNGKYVPVFLTDHSPIHRCVFSIVLLQLYIYISCMHLSAYSLYSQLQGVRKKVSKSIISLLGAKMYPRIYSWCVNGTFRYHILKF